MYDSVFVCTLITIVFICIIINCCFGVIIYINICIAHAEISFYFTPGIYFVTVGKFLKITDKPAKPAGIPVRTG